MSERRFRIMDGRPSVPWRLVEPFEAQALRNHNQTLERLNERGGLDVRELWAVVHGKRWRDAPPKEVADAWLKQWLADDARAQDQATIAALRGKLAEGAPAAEPHVAEMRAFLKGHRALLHDCPFGHHHGKVITHRKTTDEEIVAWISLLYQARRNLDEMLAEPR